jgi:Integron Cassette Protein Hfx_Cass5
MMTSKVDPIIEIGIDGSERLFVRPSLNDYEQIYRAAMEVYWDRGTQFLYSPKPRDWTYADWYSQILGAVLTEYGRQLVIDDDTVWTNVALDLKNAILELHRKISK